MTKRHLKSLICQDRWKEIGEFFGFTPIRMLTGRKWVIDWRCVPTSMTAVLHQKEEQVKNRRFRREGGKVSPSIRSFLFHHQRGICHYCYTETEFKDWTTDHKIPKSRGGTNLNSNLVGACRRCNERKGDMTDVEYINADASKTNSS